MSYLFVILFFIAAVVFAVAVWQIKKVVRRFSQTAFGTTDIIQGFRDQEYQAAHTPKTVSGMTRIELPRIQADFPEFNWHEWKQVAENVLCSYLNALETRQTSSLDHISPALRRQISLEVQDLLHEGNQIRFDRVKIHQTEIVRYEKLPAICRIKMQSAVEYTYSNTAAKIQSHLEQHRYNMELVYVQNLEKLSSNEVSFGLNCPNCGAPISSLGAKHCSYCGTAIEPVNLRAWVLHKIEKV